MADRDEIERLLQKDTEALLVRLGRSLDPQRKEPTLGLKLEDAAALRKHVKRAKSWLAANRRQLAQGICGNATVRSLADRGTTGDVVLLVAAVADCIAATCTNVAPATAAVLLVKLGLKGLCGDWQSFQGKPS